MMEYQRTCFAVYYSYIKLNFMYNYYWSLVLQWDLKMFLNIQHCLLNLLEGIILTRTLLKLLTLI